MRKRQFGLLALFVVTAVACVVAALMHYIGVEIVAGVLLVILGYLSAFWRINRSQ
jgi:hypothetical protein